MDIAVWLQQQGLSQYEALFADNAVDYEVLPELTEADLEKLGIPLGHRKKLMKAIAQIGEAPAPPPSPPPLTTPAPAKDEAERRPITVMFCDLVGSTSLSSKLDAEDWRELVGAYLDEASKAVTGFGGYVLKKLGDGIMALFGYPQAQENDAERAARAGLAIFRALDELNARNVAKGLPALAARIGLESGPVVVDQTGEVFGDAPNIAARVQAAAAPGTLLVSPGVQRQVAGLFVVEDKGPHELKGVTGKPNLYRIVRASGGGRRLGARSLTPLVGRDDELALLLRRWGRAREGEGQLIQIVGEPGLGKSRLMEEFRSGLADAPHTWVEWSSSQLLQNTPLHPVAEWGRQRFGGADVPAEQRLADLDATLAQVKLDPGEHSPLIAPLLDIPVPESRAAKLSPEEMRRRQLAAIVAWLLAGARTQPLALAFEDLHWADPTSLDLMKTLAERGAQAPMMIVATARPEFRAPWTTRSHHGILSLIPLDRAQIRKMVATLAERHALSKDTIEGLADRTGGVPLFVEEVTRLMLEGGAQTIPPTLQQSLAARLDRLGEAREVAQIGAVLGREFSYALLQAVAGLPEPALRSSLEKLVEADLLYVEGSPPSAIYRFKHALIQDAAYDSLLKNRRQALHRRAAEALVKNPEPQPELVAHHFTQSGQTEPAIEWWGKAGDAALRRSAFQEAISHLGKAIEMADKGGGTHSSPAPVDTSANQRAKLQTDYGRALMWGKGFSSEESRAAFARVAEIAETSEDLQARLVAYDADCQQLWMRGKYAEAQVVAETFLRRADAEGRPGPASAARRALGYVQLMRGFLPAARSVLTRALADYAPDRDADSQQRFNRDTEVSSAAYLAWTEWCLGEAEQARGLIERANRRATELGQVAAITQALFWKAGLEALRDDPAAAMVESQAVVSYAETHGVKTYTDMGRIWAAWARGRQGDPLRFADELEKRLEAFRAEGNSVISTWHFGLLADLRAAAFDVDGALLQINRGLTIAGETGEHIFDSFLHRLRGEALLKRDTLNPAPAEQAFRTAVAIATEQGARSYVLLASHALAKLYQTTKRPLEAHDALRPALEGFAPTPEFPAIAEAQALLAALAETAEVKAATGKRRSQAELYANYTRALSLGKGYGHAETGAAAARARETSGASSQAHFDSLFLQTMTRLTSGDAAAASHAAETMLREAEAEGLAAERRTGLRMLGITRLFQGRFPDAEDLLTRALEGGERDDDAKDRLRFLHDHEAFTLAVLAVVNWLRGEFASALAAAERARAAADALRHPPTSGLVLVYRSMLDARRGEFDALVEDCEALRRLGVEYGMPQYLALCDLNILWARARANGDSETVDSLRKGFLGATEIWKHSIPFSMALLAEAELGASRPEAALASAERALAFAADSGIGCEVAWLHRLRGDALLQADPVAAATAYGQAVEIAKAQGARTFRLQAALALAKLHQTTNRLVDAHDVLAPALEGFAPTSEFPAIAEAHALLAELDQSEAVRADRRNRGLRARYAQAVYITEGATTAATRAAFERVDLSDFAKLSEPEHVTALYGHFLQAVVAGRLREGLPVAEAGLRDGKAANRKIVVAVARRLMAVAHYYLGSFVMARRCAEQALSEVDERWAAAHRVALGNDILCQSQSIVAQVLGPLGEIETSSRYIAEAERRANETGEPFIIASVHVQDLVRLWAADLPAQTLRVAQVLGAITAASGIGAWVLHAKLFGAWASGRLGDPAAAASTVRECWAELQKRDARLYDPIALVMLADLAVSVGADEDALRHVAEGLEAAAAQGAGYVIAPLHRLRGRALAGAAGAEEAFLESIGVAKAQGARTYELLAALALAKLHQTNNQLVDAYDVLATALEGFPPLLLASGRKAGDEGSIVSATTLNPDPSPVLREAQDEGERGTAPAQQFPVLAEAHALLAALEADPSVEAQREQRKRRLDLQLAYGSALIAAKGYAAPEARAAYDRALTLTRGDAAASIPALYGAFAQLLVHGRVSLIVETAERAERETQREKGTFARGVALRMVSLAYGYSGDYQSAKAPLEEAIAILERHADVDFVTRFGEAPLTGACARLVFDAFVRGEFETAAKAEQRAFAEAEAQQQGATLIYTHGWRALSAAVRRDPTTTRIAAEAALALSAQTGAGTWIPITTILSAWAKREGFGAATISEHLPALHASGHGVIFFALAAALAFEADPASDAALALLTQALSETAASGYLWLDAEARRALGEGLLRRGRHEEAEAALRRALELASAQGARTFELRAALALAKLYQTNSRLVDAHDALAPSLEAFLPSLLPPGRRAGDEGERGTALPALAEAHALLAELAADATVAAQLRQRDTRAKLHSGYALASMMTKGFAAEETKTALARAESATGTARTPEYWRLLYGRISAAFAAADFATARASAEAFLEEAEALRLPGHAAFARRLIGFQKTIGGDFPGAAADLRRALAETDAERDAGLSELFGMDLVSTAMAACAQAIWYLGEFDESHRLTEAALAHAKAIGQPSSWLHANVTRIILGLMADRPDVVLPFAEQAGALAARHDLKYWSVVGPFWADWARARLGQPRSGNFRDHFAAVETMGVKIGLALMWAMLADVERVAGRKSEAIEAIERAPEAGAEQGETRTWQLRLNADLRAHDDPVAAEAGYREAIQLASEQGSPVLALLGALSLAKFLAGRGRALEAHDALSPALEGFTPTPHLPAIAEAQALLASLAADETVATQLRQRQVRAKLHSGYALATMMTKGFAADETKAALARAGTVAETARTPQYWTVLYGRVGAALSAADLPAARAAAEAFLAEAESLGLKGHAAFARRAIGFQKMIPGDFRGAAADLRRALAETDAERDAGLSDLFGMDVVATAMAACAQAIWYLGEFDESARLTEAALAHAKQSGRPVSWLHANANRLFCGFQSRQPELVLEFAEQALTLAHEIDLKYWKFGGLAWADWARARLGLPPSREFLAHLDAAREMGVKLGLSLFHGMHADVELAAGRKREALEAVERALDHGAAKGEGEWTTWLLCVRAAALAEVNPQGAEASHREALEVARRQGSPTLALISALALAKFLAGRGRGLEAHDALAPALEGLAPTPHLPAIAEAQALLAELAADEAVAAQLRQRHVRAKLHSGFALATMMTKGFGADETKTGPN